VTEERVSTEARELLELIDRLEALLERSELTEIEVESGGTAFILRTPAAIADQQLAVAADRARSAGEVEGGAPGEQPAEVQVGQVIGLIEAMKLFNEIKSDISGRITRICVESGALVKAKQTLIEVEPA
jgi:acetyl/propionyl-CoA carboxylase alpha subunit